MKKRLQFALLLFLFSFFTGVSFGQEFNKKYRYISIGANINAMNYVGELDPGPSFFRPAFKFTRPNLGITGLYRLGPRLSIRGNVFWGRIKGDDYQNANYSDKNINRKIRGLSFRNDIFEVKADAVIDLFENRGRYIKRPDYTPYLFIGIAYFHHNPKTYYNGRWVNLQPVQTEGKSYSLHQISIPFGVGFRYKLAKQWDLAFEIGWRKTFTDYLDDVGGTYADKSTLSPLGAQLSDRSLEKYDPETGLINNDPELTRYIFETQGVDIDPVTGEMFIKGYGREGDQRGDKKGRMDWYIVTGFHLTYILPSKVVCPKFR
ncbi:MAG: DUF6089 family protein [Cytophagaceae bacterium]